MNAIEPTTSRRSWFGRAYGPLFEGRTWAATLHLIVNLALGIAWFTVVTTLFSTSVGLLVTLIGLPLLVATVRFGRVIGAVERGRARALFGVQLAAFPRLAATGTFWQRSKKMLGDRPAWRGLAFGLIALPWGILTFTLAVVVWSVSL
ncbi:MAG TPA: sensor domain-containing protein, partial [Ilumatobacteraceae bacterium]